MLFIPPLLFRGSTRSPREGGKRFTRFADCRLKVHICTGANINANKFDADGRLFTHPDIDIDAFDKFDRFNYCQTSPNWARLRIYVFQFVPPKVEEEYFRP